MLRNNLARTLRRGWPSVATGAALALAASAAVAAEPTTLAVDIPSVINGIEIVCTGIGQTREDPRWQAYGVRVEFSNALNEYLVGGLVTIAGPRGQVLSVSCDAPWVLLKLPVGDYRVEGRLIGSSAKPRSASFRPPSKGQQRLVLQFPDA